MTSRKPKTFHITVPGRPVGKERPRLARNGRAFTPKKTLDYEKKIREHAAGIVDTTFETEGVRIRVDVYVKSRVRADVDNYVKSAMDALNKFAYKDDKLVTHIEGFIHYVDNVDDVRMEIIVYEF